MGNPHGKRNSVTAGKISSKKPRPFGDNAGDMLGGNENLIRQFISGMAMPSDRIRAFLEGCEH